MEYRTTPPQPMRRAPDRRPSLIAAEHMALEALGPYDAEPIQLPPPRRVLPREEQEDGRLLRLSLLPLASWCVGVLFDLPADEMLCAVMVAGLVAGAIALRR
ncbi:MAG: hypothetical protein JWR00_2794 [Rubritepida sp.]|nr:hypothetical protein [Rubritepida sp.]